MAEHRTKIVLTAEDVTGPAFDQMVNHAGKAEGAVKQLQGRLDNIGRGGSGGGAIAEEAQRIDRATRGIITSVQRQIAVMEAGGNATAKYYEAIASQRGANMDVLRPYLAQLDQLSEKHKQGGISAAQMQNAMRMLPAQMTDIVTGLASGQQPMTVLIQQGGQLKDMFGGAGTALRAVAGSIMGLINPVTVGIAVVGALGVAAYQGARDQEALERAIILSGNAAATTSGRMGALAAEVSGLAGVSKSAGQGAVEQIVASGKIGAGVLDMVAETAVRMEREVDQSVSETVKIFSDLGKTPYEASRKLDEQINHLTLSQLRQIKVLEDSGRIADAARMAQEAYATAMKERTGALEGNLGTIERLWRSITTSASDAWTAMKGVGKESSLEEQIAKQQKYLAGLKNGPYYVSTSNAEAELAALQKKKQQQDEATAAKQKENEAKAAGKKWDDLAEQHVSKQTKMMRELAQARETAAAAGITGKPLNDVLAGVREKYTEKKGEGDYARLLSSVNEKVAQQEQEIAGSHKLGEAEKMLSKFRQDLTDGTIKLTAAQQELIRGKMEQAVANEKQIAQEARIQKGIDDRWNAGMRELDSIEKQVEAQRQKNEVIGLSAAQVEALSLSRMDEEIASKKAAVAMFEENDIRGGQVDLIKAQIKALEELRDAKATGATRQAAADEAQRAADAWKKTSDDINRSLTDAIMRGGKSGLDYLKGYARTLILRPAIEWAMSPVSNAMAGMFSGGGGGGIAQPAGAMNIMPNGTTVGGGGAGGNVLGTASTMWSVFSGSMASTMGGMVTSVGSAMGSTALSSFGMGMQGVTGVAANAGAASAGAAVASAVPYVAAAIVALSVLGAFDDGPKHRRKLVHGAQIPSAYEDGKGYVDSVFGRYGYDDADTMYADGKSMARTLSAAAKADKAIVKIFDLNDDQVKGVTSRLAKQNMSYMGEDMSDQDAIKRLITSHVRAAFEETRPALVEFVDAIGPDNTEQLMAFATAVRTGEDMLVGMGKSVDQLSAELIKAMGGADSFAETITGYQQAMYSESERQALSIQSGQKSLSASFAELNIAIPATELEFRKLVEAQDLTTESGRKTAAKLMELAPAFKGVDTAVKSLATSSLNAYASLMAVQGNGSKAVLGTVAIGQMNDDAAQSKLAYSFGTDRATLDKFIDDNGGLVNTATKYWGQISEAQRVAVVEAGNARAAYIQTVRGQFDAQLQIVRDYAGKVQALKGFSGALASDIAGIQIAAGQLDRNIWLNGQIGKTKRELAELELNGAGVDELLASASTLRDLTLQRYQIELDSQTKLKEFATATRDYLAALKVGDKSPLALVDRLTEAASQYQSTLAKAGAGDDHARSLLTGQADTWLGLAKEYGMGAWASAYDKVQAGLSPLADVPELTDNATATARGVKDAVTALGALKTKSDSWSTTQLGLLGQAVRDIQPIASKLDQLGAGGAIESAIRDLPKALAMIIKGQQYQTTRPDETPSIKTGVPPASSPTVDGYGVAKTQVAAALNTSNDGGVSEFRTAIAGGATVSQIAGAWNSATGLGVTTDQMIAWAHERGIPGFDVGINSVPNDMLAVIHKDERILPAADNRELFARLSSPETNYRVIAEGMAAMRAELAALRNQLAQTEQAQANRDHAQLQATKRVALAVSDVEGAIKV